MKPPVAVQPKEIILAVSIGVLAAVVLGSALSRLGTPEGFSGRLDVLSTQVARIKKSAGLAQRSGALGAVCERHASDQASLLTKILPAMATQYGVQLSSAEATPEEPNSGGAAPLAPVHLQFGASGSYEGVMGLLDSLSRSKPQVFVDTLDLTSKTSSVEVKFSGRVFCAART